MFFNWRGVAIVLALLTGVLVVCMIDLSCSGSPSEDSTLARVKGELAEGRNEYRYQKAEELAALARDLRVLAVRYKERGQNRKAQRAIAAAQDLDRRIAELRSAATREMVK